MLNSTTIMSASLGVLHGVGEEEAFLDDEDRAVLAWLDLDGDAPVASAATTESEEFGRLPRPTTLEPELEAVESHPLEPAAKVPTPVGLLQDSFAGILSRPRAEAVSLLREWVLAGDVVPDSMRGRAWTLLLQATGFDSDAVYDDLCARPGESSSEKQILLDVERTLPEVERYRAVANRGERLFRILRAYSLHNPDVGYCQGMASLVACAMTEVSSDAAVFGLLNYMLADLGIADYYGPGMAGILRDGGRFRSMLHVLDAPLAQHLEENGIVPLMYMTQWFLCIFTSLERWEHSLRCFDQFLVEGRRALFRLGLGVMLQLSQRLRALGGIDSLLPYLLRVPPEELDGFVERGLALQMDDIEANADAMQLDDPENVRISAVKRRREDSAASNLAGTPRKRAASTAALSPRTPGGSAAPAAVPQTSFFNRLFSSIPSPVRSTLAWRAAPASGTPAPTSAAASASSSPMPSVAVVGSARRGSLRSSANDVGSTANAVPLSPLPSAAASGRISAAASPLTPLNGVARHPLRSSSKKIGSAAPIGERRMNSTPLLSRNRAAPASNSSLLKMAAVAAAAAAGMPPAGTENGRQSSPTASASEEADADDLFLTAVEVSDLTAASELAL
jgi:hypothetical protein